RQAHRQRRPPYRASQLQDGQSTRRDNGDREGGDRVAEEVSLIRPDAEGLLESARARAGLDDFGDPARNAPLEGAGELTSTAAQICGRRDGAQVALAFRFDAQMAAPPWLMGGMSAEAARKIKRSDAGALMGGLRYEQLCRVTGAISLA